MTIRFLKQWAGYSPDTIVTLAGGEETRLFNLGMATFDLDGDTDGEEGLVKFKKTLAGGIKLSTAIPRGASVVIDGDSIGAQGYSAGTSLKFSNHGWWVHSLYKLKQPLRVASVAAVSSQTSSQILARFDTTVAIHNPDEVWAIIGQNNLGDVDNGAQCIADLLEYAKKCAAIGALLMLGTVTPRAAGSMAAQVKTNILAINAAIRDMAAARLCVVFDSYSAIVDPASADGAARTGVLIDTVHPNSKGAFYIGREAAARRADLLDNVVSPSSNADSRLVNASSVQLVSNPKCSGTGGTVGTGGAGASAAGWNLNRQSGSTLTVTGVVNDPDTDTSVLGRVWQKMSFSGTVASGVEFSRFQQTVALASLIAPITPGVSALASIRCRCKTAGLSANFQYVRMLVETLNAVPAATITATGMADSSYQMGVFHAEEGIIECPGFVIPADTVNIRVTINVAYGVGVCAGDVYVTDVDVSVDG